LRVQLSVKGLVSARLCVKVGVENHAAESCLQQGFCQFAAVSLHRTSCYPVSLRYHQSLTCYAVSSVKASYYHLFFLTALLFGGDINPAHPKHIGSIDPNCNVAEVVKGKETKLIILLIKKSTI